ncbi:acyl-CoA thioesterase [Leptospira fletcheri]|uniref:Acyl-CoA thioesterase n=1 Tax=Leptospira fletcheri TaxID=2484981 RepID=A0A4R9GGN3_9LEPT|nr:thioesterase family protein [Leptospira fletcheri]TGK11874.1 acyl-CoA thioesterase [Leptospira fletcheri]
MLVTPIQVRWNDMDPFAHVNNARYVSYLEIGRVDYCRRKFGVKEIYDIPFLLARIEIDLLKPVEMDHNVEIVTCVSHIGNKSWHFTSVLREQGTETLFAKAKTVQVSYEHKTKTSVLIPDWIRKILTEDLEKFETAFGADKTF